MNKKKYALFVVVALALSVIAYATYEEYWVSNVNVKNIPTMEFWDRNLVDLIDEDIISERNRLDGSGKFVATETEDYINGKFDYRGTIEIKDGTIEYKLTDFKADYADIDEYVTYVGGDAVLEYTMTIKRKIPVYAEFSAEQIDDYGYVEIEIESDDFYYSGGLEDVDFIRTINK